MSFMDQPLYLSVKMEAWRPSGHWESMQNVWRKIRAEILDRDRHTCQFCGFMCPKFQHVHHIDNNHDNNSPDNLVTICPSCHACHHIGLAGMEKRGTLMWMPEISQQDLHWICRWFGLSVYADSMSGYLDGARRNFCDFFVHRKKVCEKKLGTSDPLSLANNMIARGEAVFNDNIHDILKNIRMFPGLVTDSDVIMFNGHSAEEKNAWKEQLSLLVSDPTKIVDYLNTGMLSKPGEDGDDA